MFGTKVKIDKDLLDRCRRQAERAGYSSVEEFIAHTLEKELRRTEEKKKEDDATVTDRLKGLGYID
jgi:metal-responsive CopG/Arc/MetJ family transcriptional regulator